MSTAALPFLNKTGRTQFRMSFPASTAISQNVGWYPGESATSKPELIVEYQ